MKRTKKIIMKATNNIIAYILIFIICFLSVAPYIYMGIVSLKDKSLIYLPQAFIFKPTFENYMNVFKYNGLGSYMINSAIIAFFNCILSLVLGSMAAYALARFRFKAENKITFYLLFIRILPAAASIVPLYVIASWMKILDSHMLLITMYLLFNIPFTILMMRGFFEEIPVEVEESALIDGCTRMQTLRKVVIPLATPGLVATAIFCLIHAWNEFIYALLLTTFNSSTAPTIVQLYKSEGGIIWGNMSATGIVATLPPILFAIIVQKQMVRGLSYGAVKG